MAGKYVIVNMLFTAVQWSSQAGSDIGPVPDRDATWL